MTGRRKAVSALLALVLSFGATGCSVLGYQPGPNETAFLNALNGNADAGEVTIDFDELIPGDWSRLVIVCHGATDQELTAALGFAWAAAPALDNPNFGSMIVFASDSKVITQLGPGKDESGSGPTWIPCTPVALSGEAGPTPLVVSRDTSSIVFKLNAHKFGRPVWFVPIEETDRLTEPISPTG